MIKNPQGPWSYHWEFVPRKQTGTRTIHFGHVFATNRMVTNEQSFEEYLKWCNSQNPGIWRFWNAVPFGPSSPWPMQLGNEFDIN